MAQTLDVMNGVPVLKLEEGIIGSQFKLALYFERLISENPDVFDAIDFTDMTLEAHIKDKVAKDVLPDFEFTCTARDEPGWIDLFLGGDVTVNMLQRTYEASLKVWPTDAPEQGDTLIVLILPMKYKATR